MEFKSNAPTDEMEYITERVRQLYWEQDVNCAGTMLLCLGELFHIQIEPQTVNASLGMHGAGGYRAQCGLVEGGLMFIGIYCAQSGKSREETAAACYQYAEEFTREFGSLRCRELRPGGFSPEDPPHLCQGLTCKAVFFTYNFLKVIEKNE